MMQFTGEREVLFVRFIINSFVLDPAVISAELGVQPSRAWARGEKYLGRVSDPEMHKMVECWRERGLGIWSIDSTALPPTCTVDEHFLYLLDILEPRQNQLARYLRDAETYTVSFLVRKETGYQRASCEVSSSVLERVAKLCHFVRFAFARKQDKRLKRRRWLRTYPKTLAARKAIQARAR